MRSNTKHTVEELENYILMYLQDGMSYEELSNDYGLLLTSYTFDQKILRYQEHGISGIQPSVKNNHYSSEINKQVVLEHIEDVVPVKKLARKYNILAQETVRRWIIKYTKGEILQNYYPKPEVYTLKSRKATQEERIKIVRDCLANGPLYKNTTDKYQVSYTNVY